MATLVLQTIYCASSHLSGLVTLLWQATMNWGIQVGVECGELDWQVHKYTLAHHFMCRMQVAGVKLMVTSPHVKHLWDVGKNV